MNVEQGCMADKISLSVVDKRTCYEAHEKHSVPCGRTTCKMWISHSDGSNCAIVTARKGPHTLQQIGNIFGLTRMRICHIEREILTKLRESLGG